MSLTLRRTSSVTRRVLLQLQRDRRFAVFSVLVPLMLMLLLHVFFQAADSPLFNPSEFVVPVGAFVVHFITYILCAIVLVRERTMQTLTRMLVSGFRQGEIIGGYVLAYSVLATLQSLLVLLGMTMLFELGYGLSTLLSLYLVIWLLAIISIALGILVSNFARNEGQVFPFIPLVILPSVFLSGLFVAVDKLPTWAQWLSLATPLYYANQSIQELIRPGGSLASASSSLLGLPLYGLLVLCLATLTLRERD